LTVFNRFQTHRTRHPGPTPAGLCADGTGAARRADPALTPPRPAGLGGEEEHGGDGFDADAAFVEEKVRRPA
jgi:hypothetical protein